MEKLIQGSILDIDGFVKALQDSINYFGSLAHFHDEVAQLSQFIFMNCKQLRIMRGFHEMKKAHQGLLRYLNMNIATSIEIFKGFIADEASKSITLPHQQNLDFILIKLQGLSMLLIRVVTCLKKSANYFLGLIKAGSFYSKGIVFLSTLASIWSQCRDICKTVVIHYNRLREFRDNLIVKPGANWVDVEYKLPERLEVWLGDDFRNSIANETYEEKLLLKKSDIESFAARKDKVSNLLSLVKDQKSEQAEDDEMLELSQLKLMETKDELELEDDAPIPRTSQKDVPPNVEEVEHSLSALNSKESIKAFIKNETTYRKVDPQKSLTINKMKKKVWKEFKDDIKNKSVLMQDGVLINYVHEYLEEYKISK